MTNAPTPDARTPAIAQALLSAVESGDAARLKSMLSAGAYADSPAASGETPLMRASARGYAEVARALLEAGADVNARRADGFTPLLLAVFFGHEELVRLLLESGADAFVQTRLGTTAERWADARGFAGVAELLKGSARARTHATAMPHAKHSGEKEYETKHSGDGGSVTPVFIETRARAPLEDYGRIAAEDETPVKPDVERPKVSASRLAEPSFMREPQGQARGGVGQGLFRSWRARAGASLLLLACGVAVYAAWQNTRSRPASLPPEPSVATPAPQTVAPQPQAAASLPLPSPSPAMTPQDAQMQVMPGGAVVMPYPQGQQFYVPPVVTNPAPSNGSQVPVVISEEGEPVKASGGREPADATSTQRGREARGGDEDDEARNETSGRLARPPAPDPRTAAPAAQPPVPAAPTPSASPSERRKVIAWPPQ